MANFELRAEMKRLGVFQWEIADFLGVSEMTIVRRLRKELNAQETRIFRAAITSVATKKGDAGNANANH